MEIKEFKGDFFEIGRQQGEIYRKNGMNFSGNMDENLLHSQLGVYEKYYPELLEEFKAAAKAGNFDENKLIYRFITLELRAFCRRFQAKKSCTIFGVKNNNGFFVGRNYDWLPPAAGFFKPYKVINPERNGFIAISDMGYVGINRKNNLFHDPDDAINDKGLFIGITFAYDNKWSYGLSCTHMIKLIAETCSTVKDVIKVFKKVPLCYPKNFFIADGKGNMAAVEHTSSKRFRVVYPENGVLIHTNHYLDAELAKEDRVLAEEPSHNTFVRYYETLRKINRRKENFRLSDVMRILGNTDSCVCQTGPNFQTIWSLALDMKKRRYKLYWDITSKRKARNIRI